jgi:hypothetical protein
MAHPELLSQHLHAAVQVDAHRSGRQAGAVGNLLPGHPLDQAHQQRLAIGVGQLADGVEHRDGLGLDRIAARQVVGHIDFAPRCRR